MNCLCVREAKGAERVAARVGVVAEGLEADGHAGPLPGKGGGLVEAQIPAGDGAGPFQAGGVLPRRGEVAFGPAVELQAQGLTSGRS